MQRYLLASILLILTITCLAQRYEVEEVCDISSVPSSFPVGFTLLTHGDYQYVAYYDSSRNMTVASRKLDEPTWQYKTLDNKVRWDSHNYVTLGVDTCGYVHVSGNMHVSKMLYYRSTVPFDIQSLTRVPVLIGTEENRVTYPEFMDGPNGEFIFHYRHGGSGNGYEVYNSWNPEEQKWFRYLDKPLIDGKGERNAYMKGPVIGPDNYYHLIWVWRETPDCATNHRLSYARSKDLLHWESIIGEKVELPITIDDKMLCVDDTPPGGGLLNPGISLGFDVMGCPLIGYHKYDGQMNTQLYIARYISGEWQKKQLTDWNFKWIFEGMGSIIQELSISAPKVLSNGQISFAYNRRDSGHKELLLNSSTLQLIEDRNRVYEYPDSLHRVVSVFPDMEVRIINDAGKSNKTNERYLIRWEVLPENRDKKREGTLPEPSLLRLYKINTIKNNINYQTTHE